jgi:hypothetical protein
LYRSASNFGGRPPAEPRKKAVYRALELAVACKVCAALSGRCEVPQHGDLPLARRARNYTLTTVATALKMWPARVGELELGRWPDDDVAATYRAWLNAA